MENRFNIMFKNLGTFRFIKVQPHTVIIGEYNAINLVTIDYLTLARSSTDTSIPSEEDQERIMIRTDVKEYDNSTTEMRVIEYDQQSATKVRIDNVTSEEKLTQTDRSRTGKEVALDRNPKELI